MDDSSPDIQPAVILVRPQLGQNIGAAARAMWNCGLSDLRLVAPRDAWPNPQAVAAATAAAWIVEKAPVFDSVEEAVADLHHVYATTARTRDMLKQVATPQSAARELRGAAGAGERGGFLFGPERTGLENDEVSLAEQVLHVPLNPEFASLNLAQAVLLLSWEWWRAGDAEVPQPSVSEARDRRASAEEVHFFFEHFEAELEASGFLRVEEKRDIMVRNLRNVFHRAQLREHEVRSLHGVVTALTGRRKDGRPARQPRPAPERAGEAASGDPDPEIDNGAESER
jgi:tRNA/rRNA methyltransferase